MKKYKISVIISGGQTGADRGALDFAIKAGIKHGGWCPLGRKAEDKIIPSKYLLKETNTSLYPARTRMNIRDSDATLIFSADANSKGSLLTTKFCIDMKKAYYMVLLEKGNFNCLNRKILMKLCRNILKWLYRTKPHILNVAGTRESHCPGIQKLVSSILAIVLEYSDKDYKWPPTKPKILDLFNI